MENKKQQLCQVCGKPLIDYDICHNCGWVPNIAVLDFPKEVIPPNKTSLAKAKEKVNNKMDINKPDFEDFVGMLNFYGEVEFTYKNVRYGVFRTIVNSQAVIEFFIVDGKSLQIFKNDIEFSEKANIDGILLKNLWENIQDAGYMQ